MSKIRILPEILSNKIAAGEVVERPASVVKELIENSLDADSRRIRIEVEQGGKSLIRVSDTGTGMRRDDALLAIERYATSKISTDSDLFSINTLGFRGEALPSIASISLFSLITREKNDEIGTEIIVEGGKIRDLKDVGAPPGTMITVKNIFYNTPARRKFLKTITTEMGHIADAIDRIAIGWPKVQFKLQHNGKLIKEWPSVVDPLDRVIDTLGKDTGAELYRIEFDDNIISISGWVSSTRVTRSTSRRIYVYANGRFVRDKIVQNALVEGYEKRLMKGRFPLAVLFLRVPFDQVDVNVHPTKHEVKFTNEKRVHESVVRSVSEALRMTDRFEWAPKRSVDRKIPTVSEPVSQYSRNDMQIDSSQADSSTYVPGKSIRKLPAKDQIHVRKAESSEHEEQTELWEKKSYGDLRVIGQFRNTYILCESGEELVLIDQHAAHERILFEQIKNRSSASKSVGQRLLIPETIEFGYKESGVLEALIPDLREFGLEIEPFGGNTFVVKSVPMLLSDREIKPLIIEIIEKMAAIGFTPGLETAIDECLIIMACHGAIRANQALSADQMQALLKQLDACDNPSHCPHGRPTWIQWSTRFLEKAFKRSA